MNANEAFYKAYGLCERSFPAKHFPALDEYIELVAREDKRKADFLRLLTMEMAPSDLHTGGDYNTSRVEAALRALDVDTLADIEDGNGDFMLGILYARGVMSFPNHRDSDYNIHQADLQKALGYFQRAKEKGCSAADTEIAFYSKWTK